MKVDTGTVENNLSFIHSPSNPLSIDFLIILKTINEKLL